MTNLAHRQTDKQTNAGVWAKTYTSTVVGGKQKTTRRFVLLKLTINRHEASRGLFATAELLVLTLVMPGQSGSL